MVGAAAGFWGAARGLPSSQGDALSSNMALGACRASGLPITLSDRVNPPRFLGLGPFEPRRCQRDWRASSPLPPPRPKPSLGRY